MFEQYQSQISFTLATALLLGEGLVAGSILPVVHDFSQRSIAIGLYGVILVLAILGTYGFVCIVHTWLRQHKRRPTAKIGLLALAALLGLLFVWVIYDIWWPFSKFFRQFPRLKRLHIVAPVFCTVLVGAGVSFSLYRSAAFPTFLNDTELRVEVSGCTSKPTILGPGANVPNLAIGKYSHTCTVVVPDTAGKASYGCVTLPDRIDGQTVIHISRYTPLVSGQHVCS